MNKIINRKMIKIDCKNRKKVYNYKIIKVARRISDYDF